VAVTVRRCWLDTEHRSPLARAHTTRHASTIYFAPNLPSLILGTTEQPLNFRLRP
jgi:hypothetical protein